jgi:hypothetical protein
MATNLETYQFPMGKMNTVTAAYIAANAPDVAEQFVHETDNDLIYYAAGTSSPSDWTLIDTLLNFQEALSGATLTSATVAANDKVLIQDTDNSDNLKTVTAQSIADLSGGGGGGTMSTLLILQGFSNTLSVSTPETLAYVSAVYDPEGVADGGGTDKHHLPQTGKYKVEFSLEIVPSSFGSSSLGVVLNIEINNSDPGDVWETIFDSTSLGSNYVFSGVFYISVSEDDFIEFIVTCTGEGISFDSNSVIVITRIDDGDITYTPPGP